MVISARLTAFSSLLFLFLLPHPSTAATFLEHSIGDTITADEAAAYGLFQDHPRFEQARFQRSPYTTHRWLLIEPGRDTFRDTLSVANTLVDMLPELLDHAGDSTEYQGRKVLVELRGRDDLQGDLSRWDGYAIHLTTEYGTLRIPIEDIRGVEPAIPEMVEDGIMWFEDPNRTRLFFMPTGRSKDTWQGSFGVHELVIPMLTLTFPYNVTLGAGVFPFSTAENTVAWATAQVGLVNTDEFGLAVGNMTLWTSALDTDSERIGVVYSMGTVGNPRASLTGGLGFGYDRNGLADDPFVVIGGQARLSRTVAIVSENWTLPTVENPVVSLGLRWFNQGISGEFGFVRPLGEDIGFIGIPWVSFVVHF